MDRACAGSPGFGPAPKGRDSMLRQCTNADIGSKSGKVAVRPSGKKTKTKRRNAHRRLRGDCSTGSGHGCCLDKDSPVPNARALREHERGTFWASKPEGAERRTISLPCQGQAIQIAPLRFVNAEDLSDLCATRRGDRSTGAGEGSCRVEESGNHENSPGKKVEELPTPRAVPGGRSGQNRPSLINETRYRRHR